MSKIRLIAYYLPQFHPNFENNKWCVKGFTEWTNVTKAKPLFKGHLQPHLPADLGFYDLRVPEVRQEQSDLGRNYGIDSFCYWHYWFGNGKTLLDYPIRQVLETGKPEISFCFAWANQTWGGLPFGDGFDRILIKQEYPGIGDHEKHFYHVLPFFLDTRYSKINGKPVFQINSPSDIPNLKSFIDLWQNLALKNNLPGIYFIAHGLPDYEYKKNGYDGLSFITPAHLFRRIKESSWKKYSKIIKRKLFGNTPTVYDYKRVVEASNYSDLDENMNYFPVAIPNWDHTPRSKKMGDVIINNTPELFLENLKNCYKLIANKPDEEKIIFIKSWNEWAEGNYLEPDMELGHKNLEAVKTFITSV
jgi:hypothetical protein